MRHRCDCTISMKHIRDEPINYYNNWPQLVYKLNSGLSHWSWLIMPENTRYCPNVGVMSVHHQRCWPNIKPTLVTQILLAVIFTPPPYPTRGPQASLILIPVPANTRHRSHAGSMLGQRRRLIQHLLRCLMFV